MTTLRYARWSDRPAEDPAVTATRAGFRNSATHALISFGVGLPAPELIPLAALERAFVQTVRADGVDAFQYGPSQGLPILRELICERLAKRGIRATPEDILVTCGSQQGLDLIGRVLIEPGDSIVTEAPTYMGALACWRALRPEFLSVPIDEDGIVVPDLVNHLQGRAPKFVYLVPTFQNPSGVSLSQARRCTLLELAHRHDVLLVEDDPYGELWFGQNDPAPLPIRALPGAEERVIYLGSFSKILAPGLRLGFVVANPGLMERLTYAKAGLDVMTNGPVQYCLARLCLDGRFDLDAHLATIRLAYRERRDAMLRGLSATFPPGTSWTRPEGGLFVWVQLPAGVGAVEMLPAAIEAGVTYFPGPPFFPGGGGEGALRLNFSYSTPGVIREGLLRLGPVVAAAAGMGSRLVS